MPWGPKGNPDTWRDLTRALQLEDVDSSTIQHEDLLQWNAALQKFIGVAAGALTTGGSGAPPQRAVEYYQLLAGSGHLFNLLYTPVGDVAVYMAGMRKFKTLHYIQLDQTITFADAVLFLDGDLIIFDYFYTTYGGSDVPAQIGLNFTEPGNSAYTILF